MKEGRYLVIYDDLGSLEGLEGILKVVGKLGRVMGGKRGVQWTQRCKVRGA